MTDLGEANSEIVVFHARGRRAYERVAIEDIDTLVTSGNVRLIPVLRIMHAFKFEVEEAYRKFLCKAEGAAVATLDLDSKTLEIGGSVRDLLFLEAISDVTMKADVYVTQEVLSEILNLEIAWNEEFYEYRTQVDRPLTIWKREKVPSALSRQAVYVPPDLPELLPPAQPDDAFIQFLEFRMRTQYEWENKTSEFQPTHTLELSRIRETLWGRLAGGRYKLDLSHDTVNLTEKEDLPWNTHDPPFAWAQIGWGELVFDRPSGEVAIGDSIFALGDLIFPWTQISGIRVNGLTGFTEEQVRDDRSSLGMREYFNVPHVFEGTAPVRSTVELLLNDQVIATEEIISDPEAPPDRGTYRFEDVRLPQGILNEVEIQITEEDGTETRIEKAILGSPLLLPKGKSAYFAALGAKRELSGFSQNSNSLDRMTGEIGGQIGGGRVLYGVNDQLTVGGIFAYHRDFYRRRLGQQSDSTERFYPTNSMNVGGKLSWMMLDRVILSTDVARSSGQGDSKYDDIALRTRLDYLPSDKINLNAQFIHLGDDYFDGQHLAFADRQGGGLSGKWRMHRKWLLTGAAGRVRGNPDYDDDDMLTGEYQSMKLVSTAVPRTNVTLDLDRFDLSWEREAKSLAELMVRTRLLRGWSLNSSVARGDNLQFRDKHDFFSGLKLAGVPVSNYPGETWEINRQFTPWLRLACEYRRSPSTKTLTLRKNIRFQSDNPIVISSDISRDYLTDDKTEMYTAHGRVEYFLDRVGYNRIGIDARWDETQWRLRAFLNIRQLFAQRDGQLKYVHNRRVRADQGAVQGVVFLDYNANARIDPNEPGLSDMVVKLGRTTRAVTDKNGYYIIPVPAYSDEVRVFLDLESVPALYSAVHATQLARIGKGSLTEVNLAVTPLISAMGRIVALKAEDDFIAIPGVRVMLIDPATGKVLTDSVTAQDGTYYIDSCLPGTYDLLVDTKTLRKEYHLPESTKVIEIVSTGEEFQEVEIADFVANKVALDQK